MKNSEVDRLCAFLCSSSHYQKIHFTGGEPTLHLDLIRTIQERLSGRSFEYAMTTNGWFHRNPEAVLARIELNDIIISYDKFRSRFIKKEHVAQLAEYCAAKGLNVCLNLLFESFEDLAELRSLKKKNLKINLSSPGESGRYCSAAERSNELHKRVLFGKCPASEIQATYDQSLFVPDFGVTKCTGKLLWDELWDSKSDIFAPLESISGLNSTLPAQLSSGSVGQQIADLAIELPQEVQFRSVCEACTFLNGRIGGGPSIKALVKSRHSQIVENPTEDQLKVLAANFEIEKLCDTEFKIQPRKVE